MQHSIHIIGAYLFALSFVSSSILGIVSLLKKSAKLQRFCAWGFIVSFALLIVPYFIGFGLKELALAHTFEGGARVIEKHHNMSKFVLTGSILTFLASTSVLYKYRHEDLPGWFLPNLLFLSWMIVTFLARSLFYAYSII